MYIYSYRLWIFDLSTINLHSMGCNRTIDMFSAQCVVSVITLSSYYTRDVSICAIKASFDRGFVFQRERELDCVSVQVLRVPVYYKTAVGSVRIVPDRNVFSPTFPVRPDVYAHITVGCALSPFLPPSLPHSLTP